MRALSGLNQSPGIAADSARPRDGCVMTFSYGSNSKSIAVQTQLQKTTRALTTPLERLSTGLRINSAKDDPAGLALADSLRADSKLATVAVRNASDGISLTSLADTALNEIGNILSRMGELANQSANGVYTQVQRSALQLEFSALGSEVERISQTTSFNGTNLLSNSGNITIQVGIRSDSSSQITLTSVLGTLSSLGLASGGGSALAYSIIDTTSTTSQAAATLALSAVRGAMDSLTVRRGTLGAAESRLNYAIEAVSAARDNFSAAESRIRDADIAQEVAELVRLQVIQQAGVAMLAQANQQPEVALGLLQ